MYITCTHVYYAERAFNYTTFYMFTHDRKRGHGPYKCTRTHSKKLSNHIFSYIHMPSIGNKPLNYRAVCMYTFDRKHEHGTVSRVTGDHAVTLTGCRRTFMCMHGAEWFVTHS